jgi:hypothetical protein
MRKVALVGRNFAPDGRVAAVDRPAKFGANFARSTCRCRVAEIPSRPRKFGLADLRVLHMHLRGRFPGLRDRSANTALGGLLRPAPGRPKARGLGRVGPPAGLCLRSGIRLLGARRRE